MILENFQEMTAFCASKTASNLFRFASEEAKEEELLTIKNILLDEAKHK